MWFLYNEMLKEIESLKKEIDFLSYLLEDVELNYMSSSIMNYAEQELIKERALNAIKEEELKSLNTKIENMRKQIFSLLNRNEKLQNELQSTIQDKESLLAANNEGKKEVKRREREIIGMLKTIDYYQSSRRAFNKQTKENISDIFKEITFLLKTILYMKNQRNKKLRLINLVKIKLGSYESLFYKFNFRLNDDVIRIFLQINQYLKGWSYFYEGYKSYIAIPITKESVKEVEHLLDELLYLSSYREFQMYQCQLITVPSLYQILKESRKLPLNYSFSKFQAEITYIYKRQYFCTNKYLISRKFPGDLYTVLPSFKKLEYDFLLIKTYKMFNFLYVAGSISKGVYKIGVAKKDVNRRIEDSLSTYRKYMKANDFAKIKIVESPNALNLESYLKRKFKQNRHPLIESTEWFLLNKQEEKYFTENLFFKDPDFMKIHKYRIEL